MRNILFALAEFESQRIGEEWRNVHANRRRRGLAHVARPMLGYETTGATITGVIPHEANAVRQAFELREKGQGYGEIRTALHRAGYRTKTGRTYFPQTTLKDMLRNPLYAGLVRLPNGELIQGAHEAIVDRELWERVQHVGPRTIGVARKRAGLLSGLVVCSSCGGRMGYETVSPSRRTPRFPETAIYRCLARQRSEPCAKKVSVNALYADEWIEQEFLGRLDPKLMPDGGRLRAAARQEEWAARAKRKRTRAEELTRAIDRLADRRYVKGTLAAKDYDRQFERWATERAQLEAEATELEDMAATAQPLPMTVFTYWPHATLRAKQDSLRVMIEKVTVLPAPRHGNAQRALIPERLQIAWTY